MSAVALVSRVGRAEGARAAAAALACAGSDPGRAALLIELADGPPARPALVATAAARVLERRIAAHLPEAGVASRGRLCHLTLGEGEGIERVPAALALVRDSVGVVCLPPRLVQAALGEARVSRGAAVMLRADLHRDRPLTALAVGDIMRRGLRVAVLKRPLAWVPSRRALFGALPSGAPGGLPAGVLARMGVAPGASAA